MKNKFKKFTIGVMSAVMVAGATSSLAGCSCSEADDLQVMNMSVNPGVEFIVDKQDKVVSVTASNEDGAYILSKFTEFTGMSAGDAAKKFLELSEQYGFVVSGSVKDKEITISVSGEGADELYKDVKNSIKSKVSDLGMTVAEMVKIDADDIKDMIETCYQEYTESEINDLSEEKLLEMLKASREETKGLFTEDERLEYYKERAQKIIETKIQTVKNYLNDNLGALASIVGGTVMEGLEAVNTLITNAYNQINTQLKTALAQVEAERATYIEKKEEYLLKVQEYREALEQNATEEIETLKTQMETLRDIAKGYQDELVGKLNNAKNELLSKVKETVQTKMAELNTAINNVITNIESVLGSMTLPGVNPLSEEDIDRAVNDAIATLKTTHSTNATNPWGNFDPTAKA